MVKTLKLVKLLLLKKNISLMVIILILFVNTISSASIITSEIATNDNEKEYWAVVVTIIDFEYDVNDLNLPVDMMYKPLISAQNWNEDHILFIKNENATKENILKALDWLSNQTDHNDIALFYYGGHGLKIEDKNGDESDDQDECIATYQRGGYICDDELNQKFNNISAEGLIVLIDCCFSGGLADSENKLDFNMEINEDFQGCRRVVIASTFENAVALEVKGIGTLLTLSLQRIISKSKGDRNHDEIISAEETYFELKKIFRRINLGVGVGTAILLKLIQLKFGKGASKTILRIGIGAFLLWEIFSYTVYGGIMIPYYPLIYDTYDGELPFLEITQ